MRRAGRLPATAVSSRAGLPGLDHELWACGLSRLWRSGLVALWRVGPSQTRDRAITLALEGGP